MSTTTTHRSERNCNPEVEPLPRPDFSVDDHGSIVILTGKTPACREWIENHCGDDQTQTWGAHGIVVEPRYIAPIIEGLIEAGFFSEGFNVGN